MRPSGRARWERLNLRLPTVGPGGADGEGDDACGAVPGGEVEGVSGGGADLGSRKEGN